MAQAILPSDHEQDVVERVARRFARASQEPSHYHYVAIKLVRDPMTEAVAKLAPLGEVIDLGCGRGHLALFLLESGCASRVRAVDWDEEKIRIAKRASIGLAASFEALDLRSIAAEKADTVLLLDVLHYLDADAQDALLDQAADMVRPGGRMIVREATAGHGWRSTFTIVAEWFSRLVRLHLGERVRVRDVEGEYVPRLEAKGLRCTVTPCWDGTPYANVLLVAERPCASSSPS